MTLLELFVGRQDFNRAHCVRLMLLGFGIEVGVIYRSDPYIGLLQPFGLGLMWRWRR